MYIGKFFAGLASSVLKESHCSKDSLGKLPPFIENPRKPLNFSCTQLLLLTSFMGQGEFAWEDQGEFSGYKCDDAQ